LPLGESIDPCISLRERLASATDEQLARWFRRVLHALDAMFAE
jgi:hypothetical protein